MVWPTVKLGEICKIAKEQFREGNLPYVGMEGIEGHTGKFLGDRSPKSVASSTFRFSDKHVLYGRLRPYLNKVLVPDFEGHCSSEIFPLKPSDELDRKFLYYWLSSEKIVSAIDATCTGARMPRANVKEVLTFDFSLPPLPEQKRIVAILDQAFTDIDKARALTEQNLKNARELFESKKLELFDNLGSASCLQSLPDVCDEILAGGDAPKKGLYSKDRTDKFNIPIYANAVKNNGLYGYTDYSRANNPSITIAARGSGTGHIELREEPFLPIVRLIVLTPKEDVISLEYLKHALQTLDILRTGSAIRNRPVNPSVRAPQTA
jgi:restriction endonuclease S subunit